ncbi:hypothetical protein QAD02_023645 [Eretmocerus hayati]|uniref:Uncharacterized protein n=1 Tax=Eretmocerus hayati TaxID=131215 RepID=A0ACC2PW86_9HYME|nr:hypothetical protein QAD02_023645 [Eretmocerus hayati]
MSSSVYMSIVSLDAQELRRISDRSTNIGAFLVIFEERIDQQETPESPTSSNRGPSPPPRNQSSPLLVDLTSSPSSVDVTSSPLLVDLTSSPSSSITVNPPSIDRTSNSPVSSIKSFSYTPQSVSGCSIDWSPVMANKSMINLVNVNNSMNSDLTNSSRKKLLGVVELSIPESPAEVETQTLIVEKVISLIDPTTFLSIYPLPTQTNVAPLQSSVASSVPDGIASTDNGIHQSVIVENEESTSNDSEKISILIKNGAVYRKMTSTQTRSSGKCYQTMLKYKEEEERQEKQRQGEEKKAKEELKLKRQREVEEKKEARKKRKFEQEQKLLEKEKRKQQKQQKNEEKLQKDEKGAKLSQSSKETMVQKKNEESFMKNVSKQRQLARIQQQREALPKLKIPKIKKIEKVHYPQFSAHASTSSESIVSQPLSRSAAEDDEMNALNQSNFAFKQSVEACMINNFDLNANFPHDSNEVQRALDTLIRETVQENGDFNPSFINTSQVGFDGILTYLIQ